MAAHDNERTFHFGNWLFIRIKGGIEIRNRCRSGFFGKPEIEMSMAEWNEMVSFLKDGYGQRFDMYGAVTEDDRAESLRQFAMSGLRAQVAASELKWLVERARTVEVARAFTRLARAVVSHLKGESDEMLQVDTANALEIVEDALEVGR